jgi:DNA mismatch repair protein MutL
LELKAILDIVNRFEVSHPHIKITLKNNGKLLVNKPKFENSYDNLCYVLGKELKGKLLEFELEKNGIHVKGFIANPSEITYSYKKNQYIFVNGRYIKSKLINDAIYTGFGSNLMTKRHPFFVLFIELNPEIIDVNVHPTKIEIRFENEIEIYELISNLIIKQFEEKETFKEFEIQKDLDEHVEEIVKPEITKEVRSKYYSDDKQNNFELKENEIIYEKTKVNDRSSEVEEDTETKIQGPLFESLKEYNILGQLNKTYIIVQTPNEMLLVDQHVAQEKYFYEKFKSIK